MSHVVLLGDSIFDNGAYVPGGPAVCEQLQSELGSDWQVTLLAVDGALTNHVPAQLQDLPPSATHLFVSTGGNDALMNSALVQLQNINARAAFDQLAAVQNDFRRDYLAILKTTTALRRPTVLCTIYDSISFLGPREKVGLSIFNDVIISSATSAHCPVLDLRAICCDAEDYSDISPIEPSERGGAKIAAAIKRTLLTLDFGRAETVIFN